MKVRLGFISNSSSSSFIINANDVTVEQFKKIAGYPGSFDSVWSLEEKDGNVIGITTGNDRQMKRYLEEIGIDNNKIRWKYS